jgi:hypothetical protein
VQRKAQRGIQRKEALKAIVAVAAQQLVDAALNTLTESELTIVDATISGILRARTNNINS